MRLETQIPKTHPVIRGLEIAAFFIVAFGFGVLLGLVIFWDFIRWMFSGLFPLEPKHPERPGDHL